MDEKPTKRRSIGLGLVSALISCGVYGFIALCGYETIHTIVRPYLERPESSTANLLFPWDWVVLPGIVAYYGAYRGIKHTPKKILIGLAVAPLLWFGAVYLQADSSRDYDHKVTEIVIEKLLEHPHEYCNTKVVSDLLEDARVSISDPDWDKVETLNSNTWFVSREPIDMGKRVVLTKWGRCLVPHPSNPHWSFEPYFTKGTGHFEEAQKELIATGDLDEAMRFVQLGIPEINESIRLNPKHAYSYYARGIAHGMLEQYELAIKDLDKALLLNPQRTEAYYYKCEAYSSLSKWELAIPNCDEFIRLDPEPADLYKLRGTAYQELGDYKKADKDFEKYRELTES